MIKLPCKLNYAKKVMIPATLLGIGENNVLGQCQVL
jgi:hypothetical protein